MKKGELTTAQALLIYNNSNEAGKKELEKTFGKEMFTTPSILTRVNSVQDAIDIAKPDADEMALLNYSGTNERMIGVKQALKMFICSDVLNEGKEANWSNDNEPKWAPWWNMSGGGFSHSDYVHWLSGSYVGSRLSFRDEKVSDHFAKIAKGDIELFLKKSHEIK